MVGVDLTLTHRVLVVFLIHCSSLGLKHLMRWVLATGRLIGTVVFNEGAARGVVKAGVVLINKARRLKAGHFALGLIFNSSFIFMIRVLA